MNKNKNYYTPHWDVVHPSGRHHNVYPQNEAEENATKTDKNTLICKRVIFYSPVDEIAFFEWLRHGAYIANVKGVKDAIHLIVTRDELLDADLRDLLALFYRYKIDMKQLKRFMTKNNKKWFYEGKKAYWHKQVFGD